MRVRAARRFGASVTRALDILPHALAGVVALFAVLLLAGGVP